MPDREFHANDAVSTSETSFIPGLPFEVYRRWGNSETAATTYLNKA